MTIQREGTAMRDDAEQQRRQDALERLHRLRDKVRSQNTDIQTDDEAMAIADRFVRDVIDDMVAEGKIKFERNS